VIVVDLAAIGSAGLPFGLSLAVALAGGHVRSTRRRAALNRALHELRRPLQALRLAVSAPAGNGVAGSAIVTRATVDAALTALAELDHAINGMRPPRSWERVPVGELVRAVARRWRGAAAAASRSLSVCGDAGTAAVVADRGRVERAIENLVVNALEHGTGQVRIKTAVAPNVARIAVADDGPRAPGARRRTGDPRRGHGLRIVGEVAREHGGRFLLDRSAGRTEAVLELPLADASPAASGMPAA
jgi:two-component system OmpR family sensor kinase